MKGNKVFVQTMIVTTMLAFTLLLVVMFVGIKYFVGSKETSAPVVEQVKNPDNKVFYTTTLGVVKEINDKVIVILDVQSKQLMSAPIKQATKAQDAEGNTIPVDTVKVGDMVELLYEPQKDNLVCVRYSKDTFKKTNIGNAMIDRSNRTLTLGKSIYQYSGNTVVIDAVGNSINMHQVGDHDSLEIIGKDREIYSVKVLKSQGYIKIGALPTYEGYIELNVNRQIPLKEELEPIPVEPGTYKVTLYLKGYDPLTEQIVVTENQTITYSPDTLQRTYTNLQLEVVNEEVSYIVQIGDQVFKKKDNINVPTGQYLIKIIADGYKLWQKEVNLQEKVMTMQVRLEAIEEKVDEEQTNQEQAPSEAIKYSTSISSDPEDAKVYIDGKYKGQTPYKLDLAVGQYEVILKKEGYKDYMTSILIDHSGDQNSYLYMLIPQ